MNYIFDLYGSILSVTLNKDAQIVWDKLSSYYNFSGAEYTAFEFHEAFRRMRYEEREWLGKTTGYAYPEADIRRVFARIYMEATHKHASPFRLEAMSFLELQESNWMKSVVYLYRSLIRTSFGLRDGIVEVLTALKERGDHLYILSNSQESYAKEEIETMGVGKYFDAIYYSSASEMKKPQKEYLEKLLREQNLKKEDCMYVGSNILDIEEASENDVASIYLNIKNVSSENVNNELQTLDSKKAHHIKVILSGDVREILS